MDISTIPVVTVSYNAPDLIDTLLSSFRRFYANPIHVIDGSEAQPAEQIAAIAARHPGVTLKRFGYNIHHGPGMRWAIENLGLSGPVLFLDSDVVLVKPGMLEAMVAALRPGMYGVGSVSAVNEAGFDLVGRPEGSIAYLHPACMLVNIEVLREWPLPVKHGAPLVEAMTALHQAGRSDALLGHLDWVHNDFQTGTEKQHIVHDWQGTVGRTGGYHLEEWQRSLQASVAAMPEPSLPMGFNADLLALMPKGMKKLVEVGCNTGGLARAYRQQNPGCEYIGMELDAQFAEHARQYCSRVLTLDIERADAAFLDGYRDSECWIFGDVLEHLRDPWGLLARLRRILPVNGSIITCIPNAQHWSVQARLNSGAFRYEDAGLLDRTHLRWFTRSTMLEMFMHAGYRVEGGFPRIFNEPQREKVLPAIRMLAECSGADPEQAVQDALPLQYVIKAVPA